MPRETILSRCRKLALPPLPEDVLVPWLSARTEADEKTAREAARASGGAPGRALHLLTGDGRAQSLAREIVSAAIGRGDALAVSQAAAERGAADAWPEAASLAFGRIGAALRGEDDMDLAPYVGPKLLQALDEARALHARTEGLNADRAQAALVLISTLRRGLARR